MLKMRQCFQPLLAAGCPVRPVSCTGEACSADLARRDGAGSIAAMYVPRLRKPQPVVRGDGRVPMLQGPAQGTHPCSCVRWERSFVPIPVSPHLWMLTKVLIPAVSRPWGQQGGVAWWGWHFFGGGVVTVVFSHPSSEAQGSPKAPPIELHPLAGGLGRSPVPPAAHHRSPPQPCTAAHPEPTCPNHRRPLRGWGGDGSSDPTSCLESCHRTPHPQPNPHIPNLTQVTAAPCGIAPAAQGLTRLCCSCRQLVTSLLTAAH